MHFIITGRDGSDVEALQRRMKAREEHMRGIEQMVRDGRVLYAAAMLDGNGDMTGSTLFVDFETRDELDCYLSSEPYVTGNVWQTIEVAPCKIPPVFLR